MNSPLVSVVIPAYNQAEFLVETIQASWIKLISTLRSLWSMIFPRTTQMM